MHAPTNHMLFAIQNTWPILSVILTLPSPPFLRVRSDNKLCARQVNA